jgi:phosphoserine phosphatase
MHPRRHIACLLFLIVFMAFGQAASADPLPSWNEGPAKKAIFDFVRSVTTIGSPHFVPVSERIATFDNDGTLWSEKPIYFQAFFALDRVKALAPSHPEWKTEEPYASVLKGDLQTAFKGGEKSLIELVMATHTGMTTEQFETLVADWIAKARHPKTKRLYTDMVYQPMLELLFFMRGNGFKTYIVSGGGIEFMRPWTAGVYGIPPEQVVGSSVKTQFEIKDGKPVLMRLAKVDFIDDKAGKPVGINAHIGRRPVAAFGNSDGDIQMLQWATAFRLLVHHTDAEREWAYDKGAENALKEAVKAGWTVVDMKNDWKTVYPPAQ